jgi:hypothetical protein
MQSSVFESEVRKSLLTVFQQSLRGWGGISCTHLADLVSHWKAGLANTISNLGVETFDHQSSLEWPWTISKDKFVKYLKDILIRYHFFFGFAYDEIGKWISNIWEFWQCWREQDLAWHKHDCQHEEVSTF